MEKETKVKLFLNQKVKNFILYLKEHATPEEISCIHSKLADLVGNYDQEPQKVELSVKLLLPCLLEDEDIKIIANALELYLYKLKAEQMAVLLSKDMISLLIMKHSDTLLEPTLRQEKTKELLSKNDERVLVIGRYLALFIELFTPEVKPC